MRSYSSLSAQVLRGSRIELSTPGTATGTSKPKFGIVAELDILQAAVERCIQERAGFLDRHALADAVLAAGPAGVDQPAVDIALGDALLEQVAVDRRMARHERRAEAGREGGFRLGHSDFGAGDLGRVARKEVVHRLVGRQLCDRRKNAEGVGGQHDDVLRQRAHVRVRAVGDVVDRIRAAAVFGIFRARRDRVRE